jgi:hypothetical protein
MNAVLKSILDANPDLQPGGGGMPQPMPGSAVTRIELLRAQQPGGELLGYVQSQDIVYFEQLYRKLPPNGMYAATPNKPVTFTLGAFQVPKSMVLVIVDYSFDIYRFSGASASDFVPVETNRLSTQVGWDITVDQVRQAQLSYQIIPGVQTQNEQTFPSNNPLAAPQAWQFDAVRASQNQGPAGPALSLMPQRHHRPGLVKVANNYVARSTSVLRVACSIINYVPIPIGFFEANVCGILMPQNVYDSYQKAAAPIGDALVPKLQGSP